jgi:DNA-3-methyladenine glycosylase
MSSNLTEDFFARNTIDVAQDLLGKRLVRISGNSRIAGIITETEAYRSEEDLACHCRAGKTPRTEVMYGPPGRAYVYFIYGMHWLLNFVTEETDFPGAVLVRAIHPLEGLEVIASRRGHQPPQKWTDGPAKLCQALDIDGDINGINICQSGAELFVEDAPAIAHDSISSGPRIGLNGVPEPWRSIPWRFVVNYQNI